MKKLIPDLSKIQRNGTMVEGIGVEEVEVKEKSPIEQAREEAAEYVDALDHIMRVANASRTQTRRLRWIAERARCALEGGNWRELDLPRSGKTYEQKYKELKDYAERLERVNKAAREFKAAWDKDVNFETLLAKDKLFEEIEKTGE